MRVVIVGGGTAGCVVAGGLSARPDHEVVLVEAGAAGGPRADAASTLADLADERATWPGTYVRGRGLGGSSRVNGAVLSGDLPDGVPSEVVADDELGPVDRALLTAPGAERVRLLRRDGRPLSTADIALGAGRARPNLRLVTGVEARRVEFRGRRAVGVELDDGSTIAADRVVLCAGAIGSPVLLLRSEVIGPRLGRIVDHAACVIDLDLTVEVDAGSLVTGAVLRDRGVELIALNHVGAQAPRRGALIAGWLGSARRGRVDEDGTVAFDPLDDSAARGVQRAVDRAIALLGTEPFRNVVERYELGGLGGYWHAAGSCREVVDRRGAVVGYDGLYVVDASTVDLPPHGPMSTVIAAAQSFCRP